MRPAREVDAVINTSIAVDVAVTPAVKTPVHGWLLALLSDLCDALWARQRLAVDRIIRVGLVHVD